MLPRFNRSDQIIFFLALIGIGVFSYLTANESLLFRTETKIDAPVFGRVTNISNDVRHKKTKQLQWKSARSPSLIHLGDSIFTGPDSTAKVELQGGSQFDVSPNSMIYFDRNASNFTLNLEFGSIDGRLNAGKLNLKIGNQSLELNSASGGEISLTKSSTGEGYDIQSKSGTFDINSPLGSDTLAGGHGLSIAGNLKEKKNSEKQKLALEEVLKKRKEKERLAKEAAEKAKIIKSEFVWIKPEANSDFEIKLDANRNPIEIPKVMIEWRASPNPEKFVLEFAKTPDFASPLTSATLASNVWTAPELPAGDYYVRVRPETVLDNWSSPLGFSMVMGKPKPLPAPILVTQEVSYQWPNKEPVRLEWKKVAKAKKYKVEISDRVDFKTQPQVVEASETSLLIPPPGMGRRYFRVNAEAASGLPGIKSKVGYITVSSDRPVMNAVESIDVLGTSPDTPPPAQDVQLEWKNLGESSTYEVQVSKDSDFTDAQTIQVKSPTSQLKIRSPGKYFSRVRAVSETGAALTEFSEAKSFNYKYRIPLVTPVPIEPAPNYTLFFQKPEDIFFWLAWKPVRGTDKYEIEVAKDAAFKERILATQSQSPRLSMRNFNAEGNFYWRVRAVSEKQISNWSEPRSMKVITARSGLPAANSNRQPAEKKEDLDGK